MQAIFHNMITTHMIYIFITLRLRCCTYLGTISDAMIRFRLPIPKPCRSETPTQRSSSGEIKATKSRKADNFLGMVLGRPVKNDGEESRSSEQVKFNHKIDLAGR